MFIYLSHTSSTIALIELSINLPLRSDLHPLIQSIELLRIAKVISFFCSVSIQGSLFCFLLLIFSANCCIVRVVVEAAPPAHPKVSGQKILCSTFKIFADIWSSSAFHDIHVPPEIVLKFCASQMS